uniref:Serine/threonine-protein kinase haspin n=2 Tax=Cyprinus carpio TaxID=7962 RepID=A0A8C1WVU3_CYPCA
MYMQDSTCGWLQGTSGIGLAVTPLRMEQMNLSSILANFTPDTLTTHSWGRLKAALSLHKKKTGMCLQTLFFFLFVFLLFIHSEYTLTHSLISFVTILVLFFVFYGPLLSMVQISYDEDISDAEKVYQECQQSGPLSFSDCIPPARMKHCNKIGEGTFGEVFSTINESNETVALKIIPVEGSQQVNGEHQKTFGEILHEIIISKELSSLNTKEFNKTDSFIGLNNLHCVRGRYPEALLKAWDKFDRQKGSENDRPDFFDDEQLFLILEFEFGGSDLENMNGKLSSMVQAKSVLHQVTAALAVAEQALCFEHRDLHWGNILVKNIKHKHNEFILNGTVHSIETRGVHVNIIDYSLSRLEIDGLTVSCDISNDEELFMGQGDYQFEIYRLMKKENNNCWSNYNPHSNVLWLHYLADKLLSIKYKSKAQSNQQRTLKIALKSFQSEILNYPSATEALMNCKLFK